MIVQTTHLKNRDNKILCEINLVDTYLDLRYYDIKITYWDKEEFVKKACPSLGYGDALLLILNKIDAMNDTFNITIQVKNDEFLKKHLMNISRQHELKDSVIRSAITICSNVKSANYVRAFFEEQNVVIK